MSARSRGQARGRRPAADVPDVAAHRQGQRRLREQHELLAAHGLLHVQERRRELRPLRRGGAAALAEPQVDALELPAAVRDVVLEQLELAHEDLVLGRDGLALELRQEQGLRLEVLVVAEELDGAGVGLARLLEGRVAPRGRLLRAELGVLRGEGGDALPVERVLGHVEQEAQPLRGSIRRVGREHRAQVLRHGHLALERRRRAAELGVPPPQEPEHVIVVLDGALDARGGPSGGLGGPKMGGVQ